MPVVALVITLAPDAAQRAATIELLTADPQLTVGQAQGVRLPVVVEGDDDAHTQAALRRTEQTDGVALVEVISVDFSDVQTADAASTAGRAHRQHPGSPHHGT